MVEWKRLTDRAEQELHKRGGIRSFEEDGQELRVIPRQERPFTENLRRAAAAMRERRSTRARHRGGEQVPSY
jgi:hypothetical protein